MHEAFETEKVRKFGKHEKSLIYMTEQVKRGFTNYQPKKLLKQLPARRFEFSKKENFEKNEKNNEISKKLNISKNFGFFSKS